MVNQYYFYCVDQDFGPFFIKFCSSFPYNAKLCLNGNHWAQQQAAKAWIGFIPLDNAFATVDDPAGLQQICDRLSPDQIQALLDRWLALLPNPFTQQDRDAGYRYDMSVLQAELSLTQMLDRPVSGRIFFEQVIRDNLDIGRPDHLALVFGRRLFRKGPTRPRDVSAPGSSPTGSPRACTWTTGTPPSGATTRKDGRCGPRPPSTTPATSTSADVL
jgi:hypothetical protein